MDTTMVLTGKKKSEVRVFDVVQDFDTCKRQLHISSRDLKAQPKIDKACSKALLQYSVDGLERLSVSLQLISETLKFNSG